MPTSSKPPIPTHINAHAKATLRLIFPNLAPIRQQVPNIYPAIIRSARQELPIFTQRNSPDLTGPVPVRDLAFLSPF